MSMQDPLADMCTRLRNAQSVGKPKVSIPASKMKVALARLLKDEGYIQDFSLVGEGARQELQVQLKYYNGKPVISRIDRVSRPSRRIYCKRSDLPNVLNGLGTAVISTSAGLMSDRQARAAGHGGEVICFVS